MDQKRLNDKHIFRGLLQSDDGIISNIIDSGPETMTFETTFGLSDPLIDRLKHQPQHIVFSERSRIARLGVQIKSEPAFADALCGDTVTLSLVTSSVIPGYPGLDELRDFFTLGMPVGRLVFCDPEALLSSRPIRINPSNRRFIRTDPQSPVTSPKPCVRWPDGIIRPKVIAVIYTRPQS